MDSSGHAGRIAALVIVAATAAACTVQLVAPYDADLAQKASAMQAEVAAWDLTMRQGAGTVTDDPRHPDVTAMTNKWHGEAEAMLTLAVSNDPGAVNCGDAAKSIYSAVESAVDAELQKANGASAKASSGNELTTASGCETALVARLDDGLRDVEKGLKYCTVAWAADSYFSAVAQNRATAPSAPLAPDAAAQDKLRASCDAEFKVAEGLPTGAAGAQHGRAVSALLTTLQAIVYVENRKKAAQSAK